MIFDSHAHYDDERFDEDRHSLLAAFPERGRRRGAGGTRGREHPRRPHEPEWLRGRL